MLTLSFSNGFFIQTDYYFEDAKVNWALGNGTLASKVMEKLTKEKRASFAVIEAQRIYGDYLADGRSSDAEKIISYFEKSIEMSDTLSESKDRIKSVSNVSIEKFVEENRLKAYESLAKCE